VAGSVVGAHGLDRAFVYDALYQLLSASGRECPAALPLPAMQPDPWDDLARVGDPAAARGVAETFHYDVASNLVELKHSGGSSFTRTFNIAPGSNRLSAMVTGSTSVAYQYDASGNLIVENTDRRFEWDHANRLRSFCRQAGAAEPSVHAHYLYGADGRRVMKFVRKQGGLHEITVRIDGVFEHYRWDQGGSRHENNRISIGDPRAAAPEATLRVGDADDQRPDTQYQYSDHLGSVHLVLDDVGTVIIREEYLPYGETSFGGFGRKRYRFAGKTRDEESGLYDHGVRMYSPWLGRFASCDPAGTADGLNPFAYARQNPLSRHDPDGRQSKPANQTLTVHSATNAPAAADPEDEWRSWESIHGSKRVKPKSEEEPEKPDSLLGALARFVWRKVTGDKSEEEEAPKRKPAAPPPAISSLSPPPIFADPPNTRMIHLPDTGEMVEVPIPEDEGKGQVSDLGPVRESLELPSEKPEVVEEPPAFDWKSEEKRMHLILGLGVLVVLAAVIGVLSTIAVLLGSGPIAATNVAIGSGITVSILAALVFLPFKPWQSAEEVEKEDREFEQARWRQDAQRARDLGKWLLKR
jgi:RHS repeat-associated protein